jgi:hypothetical protein
MKILYLFLCCFLLAITIQCQKNTFQESPVAGTWIETASNTDTLEFLPEYDGQNPIFWLKRGKNEDNLPKSNSGPYSYKLSENTISMNWFLSSNMSYHEYFFELSQDKEILKIGNFYNNPYVNKDTLIFTRVK